MEYSFDFGFGFDNHKFSDRTLLIQINSSGLFNKCVDHEADESSENVKNKSSVDNATTRIKTIHISTIILVAQSPFFFKLFSNGMAESKQRHVNLQIQESEEDAFMDLLNYMYTNMISSATPNALLDVLMAADKYEVESCMEHCFQLLHKLPMTFESALLFSDLPSTILMAHKMDDMVQSLIDVAKEFLVAHFNTISGVQKDEEILSLPLVDVEAVLSGDDLRVVSDDEIYDIVELNEQQEILNSKKCSMEYNFGFGFDNQNFSDQTLVIKIITQDRRLDSGHEADESCENVENEFSADNTTTRIKTIHISTIILAAKSPFFFKLFLNGMAESKQWHVNLQIQESEEDAFMDLLNYMYTSTISSATPNALLDVLMAADKYEVESCMEHCFQLLHKLPMTFESALLCLDLPSTILMAHKMDDMVQSLIDIAKEFLVAHFNTISGVEKDEEMLSLPLVGVEAVLSGDDLQVVSEDEIYDIVMKWASRHYTELNERQEILNTRLLRLIRFQFLSCDKLKEFLKCTNINHERSLELVFDALSFHSPHLQLSRASQKRRSYKLPPVKIIRLDSPREECVVYLDLKHEECKRLCSSDKIRSQRFDLCGQAFHLAAKYVGVDEQGCFGFAIVKSIQHRAWLLVDIDFSCRMKPSEEFVSQKKKEECDLSLRRGYGTRNLFGEPWDTFIAEDSPYFINGVLHLRTVITIMNKFKLF